jgi:adenylate kinase
MVILMGIAGSGKGTQGKLLSETFGLQYVSSGEMLRAQATDEQKQRMQNGELLDDQEIIDMMQRVIAESSDPNKILIDGVPRTIAQAKWLVDQANSGLFELPIVFHLIASRDAVKARLAERARADDHDEAIEARFREYETATTPVVDWLKVHNITIYEINGERPITEIQTEIANLFQTNNAA